MPLCTSDALKAHRSVPPAPYARCMGTTDQPLEIRPVLRSLLDGHRLGETESEQVFEALLTGAFDDAQVAGLLALLQSRGVTADELVGAARVMRAHVERVPFEASEEVSVVDTCGTGGAPKTFNVSTAAALIAAAATPPQGRPACVVAKHGNRSRTGRGSAEILMELGVNVDASPELQAECLGECGVCFCFAIHHHPAMKHAIGPRKSLGFPTVFNLLGPLTNPAAASRQLIGVYAPELVELVATALAKLGTERAIVAHGSDGLDEITVTGPTALAIIENGSVRSETLDPASLGLKTASLDDLRAGDMPEAVASIRSAIGAGGGDLNDPKCSIARLNAAAALFVAGTADSIEQGLTLATEAVSSGNAAETLESLRVVSHRGVIEDERL